MKRIFAIIGLVLILLAVCLQVYFVVIGDNDNFLGMTAVLVFSPLYLQFFLTIDKVVKYLNRKKEERKELLDAKNKLNLRK